MRRYKFEMTFVVNNDRYEVYLHDDDTLEFLQQPNRSSPSQRKVIHLYLEQTMELIKNWNINKFEVFKL